MTDLTIRYPKQHKTLIAKLTVESNRLILPYGSYCNAFLAKLKKGERIMVQESWRKTDIRVIRFCKIPTASAYFTFELHSIYGEQMTFDKLCEEWTEVCVNEGLGKQAYDRSSVFLVEYEFFDKEVYEAEELRKQEIAEAMAKQAESDRLLQQAREKGVYEHKDILR